MRQFGKANCDIKYCLFKSYCLSLYGCQLFNFASKYISNLYICWRKCVRRLYQLSPRTHCDLLHLVCQDCTIEGQLHARFLKFFFKAYNSENICVSLCSKIALHGSRSNVCHSLNFICNRYSLYKFASFLHRCPNIAEVKYEDEKLVVADAIRDFVLLNEHANYENVTAIIELLCMS